MMAAEAPDTHAGDEYTGTVVMTAYLPVGFDLANDGDDPYREAVAAAATALALDPQSRLPSGQHVRLSAHLVRQGYSPASL